MKKKNTYIFVNMLNSNIEITIKAYNLDSAWEVLYFTVIEIEEWKLS